MNELLCVSLVAKQLNVSKKRIYQLIHEGSLDSLRVSPRRIRVTRDSVNRFITEGIRKEKSDLGLDLPPMPSRRRIL